MRTYKVRMSNGEPNIGHVEEVVTEPTYKRTQPEVTEERNFLTPKKPDQPKPQTKKSKVKLTPAQWKKQYEQRCKRLNRKP